MLDVARASVKANTPAIQKLTGKGITIAVVDTGIYEHQDWLEELRLLRT